MEIKDIKDPSFLKEMNIDQLNELASEIREFLVDSVSKTGGHLASNLGIVELTIALHYCFNAPEDKIFLTSVIRAMFIRSLPEERTDLIL